MQGHADGEVMAEYGRLKDANFLLGEIVEDKYLAIFK